MSGQKKLNTVADVDYALDEQHGAVVNRPACWLLIDALLDTRYAMQTAANAQPIAA